jgi:c-di-GMP phosphodiesterase
MREIIVRPVTLVLALACVMLGAFAGASAGRYLDKSLRYDDNIAQAEELAEALIRRSEIAVDYTYIALSGFIDLGITNCLPGAVSEVDASILMKGAVRGVAVFAEDGSLACSAPQAFTAMWQKKLTETNIFLPARNDSLQLGKSGEFLYLRTREADRQLVAATALDPVLYDILPNEVRDVASAHLALSNEQIVARYEGDAFVLKSRQEDTRTFKATSSRYPLSAMIAIPESILQSWGSDRPARLGYAGSVIGALLVGLAAALLMRPRTAKDDLIDAITNSQIVPYYQPIFSLNDASLVGCEALVRWIKPDGSRVRPDRFIPLAEAEGLIDQLTMQMATACARDLGPLCQKFSDFKLSINMPPDLLLTRDFIGRLDAALLEQGFPRRNLVFEITERQALTNTEAIIKTVAATKNLGYRFALDDTGVGHNGLANVQSLPVDFIKIDKCFVDLVETSAESASIVRMLVSLARELGMKTVAEGIERSGQLAALRALGVDEGQGYLIAPALAPSQFLQLAEEWLPLTKSEPLKSGHITHRDFRPKTRAMIRAA